MNSAAEGVGDMIGLLISFLIGTAILHLAVKIVAGATAKATFTNSLIANGLVAVICGLLMQVPFIGWLAALIASFAIVMKVYAIGFGRALLIWLVYVFILGGLAAVLVFVFGVALAPLFSLAALFG